MALSVERSDPQEVEVIELTDDESEDDSAVLFIESVQGVPRAQRPVPSPISLSDDSNESYLDVFPTLASSSSLSPSNQNARPKGPVLSMPVIVNSRENLGEGTSSGNVARQSQPIEVINLDDEEDLPSQPLSTVERFPYLSSWLTPGPSGLNQPPPRANSSRWTGSHHTQPPIPPSYSNHSRLNMPLPQPDDQELIIHDSDTDDDDLKPPPFSIPKKTESEEEEEDDEKLIERINPVGCCVCLEPFDAALKPTPLTPVMLTCGHFYCLDCLQRVQGGLRRECSVCRKKFNKNSIIHIKYNTPEQRDNPYRIEVWNIVQKMQAEERAKKAKNNL